MHEPPRHALLRGLRALALLGVWALCAAAWAQTTWQLGVLSFQTKAETRARWAPTARLLSAALAPDRLELQPLTYPELDAAMAAGQLDFVFTNPEHYVVLRNRHGLRPLATLSARIQNQVVGEFGSVIFTRSHSGLTQLGDVQGRRVAVVSKESLGGFLMAADVLRQAGVNLQDGDDVHLLLTGVPHSNTVRAVLLGQADVGVARTGVLEAMAAKGQINLSDLLILNAQPKSVFPQALSTPLSPEWPLAASPRVPLAQIKAATVALLQVDAASEAARLGLYDGFVPPANYAGVEALMRRLHVYPGQDHESPLLTLWLEHGRLIGLSLVLLCLLALTGGWLLWRSNRALRQVGEEESRLREDMELDAAAFHSEVGLLVTDPNTYIRRANPALEDMLGFAPGGLEGLSTAVLRGGSEPSGRIRSLRTQLNNNGHWRGELHCARRDGSEVPCSVTISATQHADGTISGYIASFADISEQKAAEAKVRRLAYYDPLTGLPNRRLFLERLEAAMDETQHSGLLAGVLFIDLDHFKNLNDTHGHAVGDQLLQRIAQRLELILGPQDLAARLGGDEFVIMLPELATDEDSAMARTVAVAERVHAAILQPVTLDALSEVTNSAQTLRHTCSGSIGVALFGLLPEPVTEVLKRADVAMYRSKQDGRNLIRCYDPSVQFALNARMALSAELTQALADGQLQLLYQVQVDARAQPVGAECLMRWHHPQRGLVSPVEFIPLAEESGAIVAMGDWVVQTACQTLVRWAADPLLGTLNLSVNVSPRQFLESDFVDKVARTLAQTGARAQRLRLEVTEGIVMQDTPLVIERMRALCAMGLSFSIDDFGTGYSSLSYLQMLPLAELKIDKSFVNHLSLDERAQAIVRAIVALGQSMGIVIVSEGVETAEQRDELLRLGSTLLQGYLFSRPLALGPFETLLSSWATLDDTTRPAPLM